MVAVLSRWVTLKTPQRRHCSLFLVSFTRPPSVLSFLLSTTGCSWSAYRLSVTPPDNANWCQTRASRPLCLTPPPPPHSLISLIVHLTSPSRSHFVSAHDLLIISPRLSSAPMASPSTSDDSPWPAQTQPPSQPRNRRSPSPLEHRHLSARQDVFNQSGIGAFLSALP